jgi:predicted ATPase
MFTELSFQNYRALKDARLSLGPLNLLVGPNGSGKTSVLEALRYPRTGLPVGTELASVGHVNTIVKFGYKLTVSGREATVFRSVDQHGNQQSSPHNQDFDQEFNRLIQGTRHYAFDSAVMRKPVTVTEYRQLSPNGDNLAGFLDYIRDNGSDTFDALVETLHRAIPEYDDIGFDGSGNGQKSFKLRRTGTKHFVAARHLSEGTLYVVALLAMVHQPELPTVLCFEEPDRGLHPRIYREVKDALYRLAYPKEYGGTHKPVQIIATTHSAHFLNEFTDHPEQIIVCEKGADHNVTFRNLGQDPQAREILGDSLLGDAWATGALGGMPTNSR